MSEHEIRFTLNGRPLEHVVAASDRLADLLRDGLGLLGTKISCEVQVCGACTVIVDDRPVSSCCYLAVDVDGCDVRTIEGVADATGQLSAVQQAMLEHGGVQCGYCTPGIVLTAEWAIAHGPDPELVRETLEGSICRCTGYEQILEAVVSVARRAPAASRRSGDG